jgi:hypothetical protein
VPLRVANLLTRAQHWPISLDFSPLYMYKFLFLSKRGTAAMATPARIAPKGAGKLASFASVRRGLSLIPFDKIGFVFHYFFRVFFSRYSGSGRKPTSARENEGHVF